MNINNNKAAPVLLIFWKRYDTFSKVFKQVQLAQPETLLFYQDGPKNDADREGINLCRKLIKTIDWPCKVYTHFNDVNVGCDPNVYNAIKWAFNIVDRCIILEDDCIVDLSYFTFATQLLEKYKDNEQINMICSMNVEGQSNCGSDYFFCKRGNTWGWATWKRVIDKWDPSYKVSKDTDALNAIQTEFPNKSSYDHYIQRYIEHSKRNIAYHEYLNSMQQYQNHQYNIIPSVNLVENIGNTDDSTHFISDINLLSKAEKNMMLLKKNSMNFPLRHPSNIVNNENYDLKLIVNKHILFKRRIERLFNKIKYKRFDLIFKK